MSFFPERNRGTDILIQIDEVQVCGDTGKEPISLQSRSFSTSGRWPYFSTPPGSTLLLKSWPACWSLLSVVSQPLLDVPTFTTSLYLLLSQMKPHCIHMSLFCSKPNQQVTHTLPCYFLKVESVPPGWPVHCPYLAFICFSLDLCSHSFPPHTVLLAWLIPTWPLGPNLSSSFLYNQTWQPSPEQPFLLEDS